MLKIANLGRKPRNGPAIRGTREHQFCTGVQELGSGIIAAGEWVSVEKVSSRSVGSTRAWRRQREYRIERRKPNRTFLLKGDHRRVSRHLAGLLQSNIFRHIGA